MLFCPICLYQEDLRPNTRRTKHIFVRGFFDHMFKHVTTPQHRCRMCALSFNAEDELNHHRQNDHCFLNPLWATSDRPVVHEPTKTRLPKKNKIAILQKKFMESLEGRRISDEVVKGTEERLGYDTTNVNGTLFVCSCGSFKSYNGNRTASHFHRCRRPIKVSEKYLDSLNHILCRTSTGTEKQVILNEIQKRSSSCSPFIRRYQQPKRMLK